MNLLLTLTGVTLLFACAQANGAMEAAARQSLRLCRGHASVLPLLFFTLAAIMAMIGPGAILSTALIAPFAMTAGTRAGAPAFLIALMVGNGANAGNMSPFSTIGAIANGLMAKQGLEGHQYSLWFFHAAAHILVAIVAYLLFGGIALFKKGSTSHAIQTSKIESKHAVTLIVIAAWVSGVILMKWPLGYSAFGAAAILLLAKLADIKTAIKLMPWKVITLVVTISTAIGFLEKAGGLTWFQKLLAQNANPQSIHALIAFLMGILSVYSSTSGVVLPAFLPMANGIAAGLPGVDPAALCYSIVIGASLVDVSPLSTLGALCLAAAPDSSNKPKLFRNLMIWGFAMAVVGALFCFAFAPLFTAFRY